MRYLFPFHPDHVAKFTRLCKIRWFILMQLCLLFALLVGGARYLSFTTDEPSHLAAGYAYLARGTAGMWTIPLRGHPLLVDAWEALPLYIGAPGIAVESLPGWGKHKTDYVTALMHQVGPLARAEMGGRIQASLLTLLLAAIVWRWATDMKGPLAGTVAVMWLSFDPILLAHGRLATNDAGVTMLGTLYLFLVWRWCRRASWRLAGVIGLIGGATLLAKGSGVVWVFVGGLTLLWHAGRYWPESWPRLAQSAMVGGVALLVVWAMYGFEVGLLPDVPWPVPAPMHWYGVFYHADVSDAFRIFALGHIKEGHWWWYFPVAFCIKNPLPFVAGVIVSGYLLLSHRTFRRCWQDLGLFPLIYLTIAITQGPNIGYRHLLPIHPFLYVLLSGTTLYAWRSYQIGRWAVVGLLLGYSFNVVATFPYEIAYFNQAVGGPENGWRYLASSNTDFRQGWRALHAWQQETCRTFFGVGFKPKYLSPQDYGIDYQPLVSRHDDYRLTLPLNLYPTPGDYVVRAHTLSMYMDEYSWFRYREPDQVIANSLFYYHVPEPIEPYWIAQCSLPAIPLDNQALTEGFQEFELRCISLDCSQTWVYPYKGKTTGWYAIHDQALKPARLGQYLYINEDKPNDPFSARHLEEFSQSFRHWEYQRLPAFALYEWHPKVKDIPIPSSPQYSQVGVYYPAPAETLPYTLKNQLSISPPIDMKGPLQFLGVNFLLSRETTEVETWWLVNESPITHSFSLMLHLVNAQGEMLEVADGLGIAPTQLIKEDVLVQRHRFNKSVIDLDNNVWLRVGAYWLDIDESLEVQETGYSRWPLAGYKEKKADAIFVPIK